MSMRWPDAGLMSSMTLVCSASVSGHQVTWPMTILPSRVAGPVAANALQWSSHRITLAVRVRRLLQAQSFESCRSGGDGAAQFTHFDGRVGHDHIDEVDAAILPARAGVGGAVGDAAHLLQNFLVEAAQEQSIRGGAIVVPMLLRPSSAAQRSRYSGISRAIRWPCWYPRS